MKVIVAVAVVVNSIEVVAEVVEVVVIAILVLVQTVELVVELVVTWTVDEIITSCE